MLRMMRGEITPIPSMYDCRQIDRDLQRFR
jgi:hypothetical protein